jgi:hypothetical protein
MVKAVNQHVVLAQARLAARAYARIAGGVIDQLDNVEVRYLRYIVARILEWRIVQASTSSRVVTDGAATLARWEASNFSGKLQSGMRVKKGINTLAAELGLRAPSLDEVVAKSAGSRRSTANPLHP